MPACSTPSGGTSAAFGIPEEETGVIAQSVKVTKKRDKKEIRGCNGAVLGVAYYNDYAEVEIEGVATGALTMDAMDLKNGEVVGKLIVTEISTDMSNEDFVKTTIKGTAYKLIT